MFAGPKKVCQYDGCCYRRNPKHFQEYSHPLQYPDGGQTRATEETEEETEQERHARARGAVDPTTVVGLHEDNEEGNSWGESAPLVELARLGGSREAAEDNEVSQLPLKRARHDSTALTYESGKPGADAHPGHAGHLGANANSACGGGGRTSAHNISLSDGYNNESCTSTAPTEMVPELSTSSSYVAASLSFLQQPEARRTVLTAPAPQSQFPAVPSSEPLPHSPSASGEVVQGRGALPRGDGIGGSSQRTASTALDTSVDSREDSSGRLVAARELQDAPPSLPLLQHLMVHDPIRDCVDAPPSDEDEEGADHKRSKGTWTALFPSFIGVEAFLEDAYSMPFLAEDVRAVLQAALAMSPTDPLRAFPPWRLVGPFELALRAYKRQQHAGPDTSHASSFFRSDAARWRCSRFRHDPPECQTVAVEEDGGASSGGERRHLCFFRDSPSSSPSLLVEGTTAGCTFNIVGTSLTAFLLAEATEAAARQPGSKDTVVAALAAAVSALDAAGAQCAYEALGLRGDGSAPSLETSKAAAEKHRRKLQLAATFHGLGISAPYNKHTELGYRPLAIPRKRLQAILESWQNDYAEKRKQRIQRQRQRHANPLLLAASQAVEANTPSTTVASSNSKNPVKPFATSDWNEVHDQFRFADMANDEGDYGLSLELGLDLFSLIEEPSMLPCGDGNCAEGVGDGGEDGDAAQAGDGVSNPLLWHAFRILDCAYMLLGRGLYRHILRCHLPVLAGRQPVLLDSTEVFVD